MPGPGFAVIDFETTGLFPGGHDRVIEAAVVHVSREGELTGHWDTLVNPERDLGAQRIHGIQSREVLHAPKFAQIIPGLVELLDCRVLVAHNASFDTRFLLAELARAKYAANVPLVTLCTMRLAHELLPGSGRSLADCCAAFDIELNGAHRASVDAYATAQLLDAYISSTGSSDYWTRYIEAGTHHRWIPTSGGPDIYEVWRPRGTDSDDAPFAFLERISASLPQESGPAAHHDYLALLDRCLLDHALSAHESDALVALATDLGVSRRECEVLHVDYFQALVDAAWADDILTSDEIADLTAVARLLTIPGDRLARAVDRPVGGAKHRDESSVAKPADVDTGTTSVTRLSDAIGSFQLKRGDQIVLTGEMHRSRSDWERELAGAGLLPKAAVTKTVKLLVAADPDSLSGKARKARQYGIPIVDEATLGRLLPA